MTPDRTVPGGVAAVLAGGALLVLADASPLGGLAGLGVVGAWYAIGPTYAFAFGQVAIVALAGDWGRPTLVGAEIAVLAVLVAPDLPTPRGRRLAAGTVAGAVGLGSLTYGAVVTWETPWLAALVLVGLVGSGSYALHRYERVATGAVTREPVPLNHES